MDEHQGRDEARRRAARRARIERHGQLREQLGSELDQLAEHGTLLLRARRFRRDVSPALAGALVLTAILALAAALVVALAWLAGASLPAGSLAIAIAVTCAVVATIVLVASHLRPVARRDALALVDRAAKLEDRLLAADEFLSSPPRAGAPSFVAAALEDAAQHVRQARTADFTSPAPRARRGPSIGSSAVVAALALVLLIATGLLPRREAATGAGSEELAVASPAPAAGAADEVAPTVPPQAAPEATDPETTTRPRPDAMAASTSADQPGELSERVKKSSGETGDGRASDARASSKASDARGAPSNQSQTSKASKDPKTASEKKDPKTPEPSEANKKRKEEQSSGSTAGQGSSKGSSKNPAATDWASKDQVSTPEDAEIEDDEEIDDEEEEQESRGGVQPAMRDRRPPVSRDLRIGFGNRPNPDANGRGGPSAPKKSRGVASLVLGVPIPDRIKGQPNAGKTKITQERIDPRGEEVASVGASAQRPRSAPLGRLSRADMNVWMRDLVRSYFLARRGEGPANPPPAPATPNDRQENPR